MKHKLRQKNVRCDYFITVHNISLSYQLYIAKQNHFIETLHFGNPRIHLVCRCIVFSMKCPYLNRELQGYGVVYLLQITLIGDNQEGFHIFEKRTNASDRPIATCQVSHVHVVTTHAVRTDAQCFTMRIAVLEEDSEIFLSEFENNSGVHYLETSSYFGLIRLGGNNV